MSFTRVIARLAAGVLILAAALVVQPAAASAQAGAGAGTNALSTCSTGRIESAAANLAIRTDAYVTAPVITIAQRGYQYDCIQNTYFLGGRYTACGVSSGNGWIGVKFYQPGGYIVGFTYQACVKDV